MKNPIIEDFDPNAKTRQLGSPLDGMPAIENRQQRPRREVSVDVATPPVRVAPKRTVKKPTTDKPYVRRTFDIYEEQLAYLSRASLEDRLNGGPGSMNAMVREALDAFIEKHRKK
jgi:hypothetical protein